MLILPNIDFAELYSTENTLGFQRWQPLGCYEQSGAMRIHWGWARGWLGWPAAGSADPASPCGLSLGQCSGWVGDQLIVLGGSSRIYFYFGVWREIENPGHQPYLSFCHRHGGSCSSYHRVHLDRSPRKTTELTKSQKVLSTSLRLQDQSCKGQHLLFATGFWWVF